MTTSKRLQICLAFVEPRTHLERFHMSNYQCLCLAAASLERWTGVEESFLGQFSWLFLASKKRRMLNMVKSSYELLWQRCRHFMNWER